LYLCIKDRSAVRRKVVYIVTHLLDDTWFGCLC